MKTSKTSWRATSVAACMALCMAAAPAVRAQTRDGPSALSAASAMPLVMSVTVPAVLIGSTAALTVVAVEKASEGTVWVLERGSDGARTSLTLSGDALIGASVVAGTAVVVTACSAGWILHAAGKALAIVPNERGRRLLHNERITP